MEQTIRRKTISELEDRNGLGGRGELRFFKNERTLPDSIRNGKDTEYPRRRRDGEGNREPIQRNY